MSARTKRSARAGNTINRLAKRYGKRVRTAGFGCRSQPDPDEVNPEIVNILQELLLERSAQNSTSVPDYSMLEPHAAERHKAMDESYRRNRKKSAEAAAEAAQRIIDNWRELEDPKALVDLLGLKFKRGGRRKASQIDWEREVVLAYHTVKACGASNPCTEVATSYLFDEVTTQKQLNANITTVDRILEKWKDAYVSIKFDSQ